MIYVELYFKFCIGNWFWVLPFVYPRKPESWGWEGYSLQKTLRGHATNMGSKISLLVYEWPLIKNRIWYMNGWICQNFPKFEPKVAQIKENFGKIGRLCSKFSLKLGRLVNEWVTFSWKIVFCMVCFQISQQHIPTKTKLAYPPPPPDLNIL